MDGLEDFLKGAEPVEAPEAEVTAEVVETPTETVEAEPTTAERPRGPDGKFIPKGEKEPEAEAATGPSVSPTPVEPPLDHAALLGERRRRQELEQRLADLEARYTQPVQQPQQQQPQAEGPPDRWEDPDGYDQWLIGKASQAARAEAMSAMQYQRIEMSATAARQSLPDYDEKIGVFGQMAQGNPALLEQLHKAPNPAEFAYNTAKTQIEISQYGGIDGLIQARVAEALKAKEPAPAAPTQSIPETLADAQSSRGSAASALSTPTLDQILGRVP